MSSRRQFLAAFGTTAAASVAGCSGGGSTAGTVARKDVTVAVPQQVGDPVEASVALLGFEPDRSLVHGEYDPEHAGAAVDGATLSVSEQTHDALADAFASVRYSVNVVPEDGTEPVNGVVTREDFGALTVGGRATVDPRRGEDGLGRVGVRETTPRESDPTTVTVSRFDLDERLDRS
ncbi:hypothetical protein ACFQMA_16705 [Halosimplex aquaticum]|uniref:Tat (Twin-arginine translocation) pathway signal sequence n=1 Tax=Halosimplex aquaticum TaxID=3026162 RepID=A0ABD5Y3K7_9EURY|nr:hypothetical protein [Halosimplex aquaticum]